MTRNFGMSGQQRLGGSSTSLSAAGADTRADAFELGSKFFSIAVIALPSVIVGGIYLAYLAFR